MFSEQKVSGRYTRPRPTVAPAEAVSHAPITAQAVSEAGGESTSVVSSVRAALLGIGKP